MSEAVSKTCKRCGGKKLVPYYGPTAEKGDVIDCPDCAYTVQEIEEAKAEWEYKQKYSLSARVGLQLLTKLAVIQQEYADERAAHNKHVTELLEAEKRLAEKEAELSDCREHYGAMERLWIEQRAKLNQAVEGLEWYSERELWTKYPWSKLLKDGGQVARQALQSIKGNEGLGS